MECSKHIQLQGCTADQGKADGTTGMWPEESPQLDSLTDTPLCTAGSSASISSSLDYIHHVPSNREETFLDMSKMNRHKLSVMMEKCRYPIRLFSSMVPVNVDEPGCAIWMPFHSHICKILAGWAAPLLFLKDVLI